MKLYQNLFKKYQSKKDKRIKNYFLVNEFAIMMNDWQKKNILFLLNQKLRKTNFINKFLDH